MYVTAIIDACCTAVRAAVLDADDISEQQHAMQCSNNGIMQ